MPKVYYYTHNGTEVMSYFEEYDVYIISHGLQDIKKCLKSIDGTISSTPISEYVTFYKDQCISILSDYNKPSDLKLIDFTRRMLKISNSVLS